MITFTLEERDLAPISPVSKVRLRRAVKQGLHKFRDGICRDIFKDEPVQHQPVPTDSSAALCSLCNVSVEQLEYDWQCLYLRNKITNIQLALCVAILGEWARLPLGFEE